MVKDYGNCLYNASKFILLCGDKDPNLRLVMGILKLLSSKHINNVKFIPYAHVWVENIKENVVIDNFGKGFSETPGDYNILMKGDWHSKHYPKNISYFTREEVVNRKPDKKIKELEKFWGNYLEGQNNG